MRKRRVVSVGYALVMSASATACGEAGGPLISGSGISNDGGFSEPGYQWGKKLNNPIPYGINTMGMEEPIFTDPGQGPVEYATFLCSETHSIALDGSQGNLTDPADISQYNNLVSAAEVEVEDLCDAAAAAANLTLLPDSSTENINCSEAAAQNDYEYFMVNDAVFEPSDCPGDGGDIDEEGMDTRAAGPANYGLMTFADVVTCSGTAPECDVDTDFVDDLIDDMTPLIDDNQNMAIGSNGFHTGLIFANLETNSLMTYVGFQNDDTVVEINDRPTTTFDEVWEAVATNLNAERIEVVYYQGRVKKTLNFDKVDLTTYP